MTEVTQVPEWFARWEQAMHGEISLGQRFVAESDPTFMEAFVGFSGPMFARPDNLITAEVREIVIISIQASLGQWEPVRGHIKRALVDGVPPKMILEGLELAAMAAGVGKLFGGAEILAEELEAAGRTFADD